MTHPPCLHCHGPVIRRGVKEHEDRFIARRYCSTACANADSRGRKRSHKAKVPEPVDDTIERRERVARLPMLAFLDPERVADFEKRMKERGL